MTQPDVLFIKNIQDIWASQDQIDWAIGYIEKILKSHRLQVAVSDKQISDLNRDTHGQQAGLTVNLLCADSKEASKMMHKSGIHLPKVPEAFCLINDQDADTTELVLISNDTRGFIYGLLELADIACYSSNPLQALNEIQTCAEQPENTVRSITRLFTSEPEDKPWFYNHGFWEEYLTELATHRFNRFTLSVGAGYDYLIDKVVLDTYFCFFYPFVVSVPGYDVEVDGLPDEEKNRNLEMIRYIGRQCRLRGMEFRLGLWNHAYDYGPNNTNKRYLIKGLNESNHALYCRDALAFLLKSCPDIQGLTFRVHFEGGVPEPTHMFWKTVMECIDEADHIIDIDFHSKGITAELLDIMAKTGKVFSLSTKYWAEHMGPPYHQASIRRKEFGRGKLSVAQDPNGTNSGTGHHETDIKGTESTHRRSFTRYGYADFLRDDRWYGMIHRVWPGTQRILTWGDPKMAAGIGRNAHFCGTQGIEWFEPLSFKGKKGSGSQDGRELYAQDDLKLGLHDWTKFRYTYRLWGRLTYNPDTQPQVWQRYLSYEYGEAAESLEESLAYATRILPFVLLVHAPSVANNVYWPEMYSNIPLVRGFERVDNPYAKEGWSANADFDMDPPYCFMNTSSLDPVLFYKINEFAEDIIHKRRSGKYSPIEISDWLEEMVGQAEYHLAIGHSKISDSKKPAYRRLVADIQIMAGIGSFFAYKFRAGLAFSLYEKTGAHTLLQEAVSLYHTARKAWQKVVEASTGIYKDDITFGHPQYARGHWADRIEEIDRDIAAMENILEGIRKNTLNGPTMADFLVSVQRGKRPLCTHTPPKFFEYGKPVEVKVDIQDLKTPIRISMHYRHVDQSALYNTIEMVQDQRTFSAVISSVFTNAPYPLMYFFEIATADGDAWMLPGLDKDLSNQPYYILCAKK